MNTTEKFPDASRDEVLAALFAQLVLQQTNMAMMLLGKIANPQTGETLRDPEAAGFFIDQLEMLEAKTRGNLGKEEATLLKQSLMNLRMAFVEVVNAPAATATPTPAAAAPENTAPVATDAPAADAAAAKRFSKKY